MTDPNWLSLAGWDERSAELVHLHRSGRHALAIFATRSNPAHLELGVFSADAEGSWSLVNEGDDVSLDNQFGWSPSCVYGWGTSQPGTRLQVRYRDSTYTVEADATGWWAFVHDVDPTAGDLLVPELVVP